ncbi:MAG TPA: AAA family ATPase [Caulobacteraceae bacterium]|nr:AAA family ATPase [Caulobacteraceae bacterium]
MKAQSDRVIETSCAWVFLQGERALKVKKPVDYGFLDFSTPDKRRWALERELAFNRATAPDIYRAVHEITGRPDTLDPGSFDLDGPGEAVDFALEMRAFDPAAVLAEQPERVDGTLAEALGRTIARFHATAELRPEGGGVKALGFTIRTNADNLRHLEAVLGKHEVEYVIAATDQALADHTRLLERRRAEGFARRCHGDLHLGNILLEHGQPVLFDCIEFNDLLSEIDVLYDVAFTVMDLWFRERREAANRLLNAYLDEAARSFPPDLWDGLVLLPLFLSARAAVRTHVTGMQGDIGTARAYLAAARDHLAPPMPTLTAIGGLSGTGKTTLARRIAPELGAAPGALVLRSDEIRKRLAGVAPTEKLPPDAYGAGTSEAVYGEMFALARHALAAGRSVVLDAVFLLPEERAAASGVAGDAFLPFRGVWLEGDAAELRQRLETRVGDASDAGPAVLTEQLARDPGPIDWLRLPAGDLEAAASRIAAA